MLFIAAQQLPSFITWNNDDKSRRPSSWLPRLKPRQVPIAQYLLQVATFASGTLLNNIVFAFSVPPTIQIVFRSAGNVFRPSPPRVSFFFSPRPKMLRAGIIIIHTGLAVSMILGRVFMDKRYTLQQTVPPLLLSLSPPTGHCHEC
jgi:UDP-xylose/UDP-N-acetylglucosamine transporter B4